MKLLRRSLVVLITICLGCSAQSVSPEQSQRIEHEVRNYYSVPAHVKITIGPLRPSDFANYDALTVHLDGNGKQLDYDFLLAKDGKTLLRMTKLDLSKDPYAENMSKMNLAGRSIRGKKDAKVVLVNFDDFQCPFCSRMHEVLFPQILKEYGDRVEFVYKDYPLSEIHPWAIHAAVDANCLAAQNGDAYWDFADYIHANQREVSSEKGLDAQFAALDRMTTTQGQKHNLDLTKLQACVKAQDAEAVKASIREGDSVGVQATPTMFVNGQELDGALPIEEVRNVLDQALQSAGVPSPVRPAASTASQTQAPSK